MVYGQHDATNGGRGCEESWAEFGWQGTVEGLNLSLGVEAEGAVVGRLGEFCGYLLAKNGTSQRCASEDEICTSL